MLLNLLGKLSAAVDASCAVVTDNSDARFQTALLAAEGY